MPPLREARLRPEFATLYPGVEPGVWYTAATLAEHLLRRHQRSEPGGDASPLPPRVLDPEHFEFRGAAATEGLRANLGRRVQD